VKNDQSDGMIRDSDIKFQCRLLIAVVSSFELTDMQLKLLLEPLHEIIQLENNRLDELRKHTDKLDKYTNME
jgi:hypothetical protein